MIFFGFFGPEVREREPLKFSKKLTGGKRGETSRVPLITNYKFLHGMHEGMGTRMQWQIPNFSFSNRWALLPSQNFTPFFVVFGVFPTKNSVQSAILERKFLAAIILGKVQEVVGGGENPFSPHDFFISFLFFSLIFTLWSLALTGAQIF